MIRKFLLLFAPLLMAATAFAQTQTALLDSLMRQYVQHKRFSGTVLVAKDGKILLDKGYGFRNVAAKTPAEAKGLYQYGSVTKQFTAALILKLQEQGKLSINDKLSKYFPELSFADSVTLRHLLTHTSGIYNYTNDARFMSAEAVKPTNQKRIFELFANRALQFAPGSKFSYSNSNYMLLGYIAEKVTGRPYEALVRQYILTPAGMNTAGFDFTNLKSDFKTTGYNAINGEQAFAAGIVDSSVSYAAGALYGSVYDLYAWHNAMQQQKVLSAKSWQQMYTPMLNHYALGVEVDSLYGRQFVSHGGGIFGFVTDFIRFPSENLVVVVLCNNNSASIGDISKSLAGLVLNQEVKWPAAKVEVTVPVDVLEQYVGAYELMPNFALTITVEKGNLFSQATGQPKTQLFGMSQTRFFLKVVDAEVEFNKDSTGKVTGLTLFQGGRQLPGKKKE